MSDRQEQISKLQTRHGELKKRIEALEEAAKRRNELLSCMCEKLTKYEGLLVRWYEKELRFEKKIIHFPTTLTRCGEPLHTLRINLIKRCTKRNRKKLPYQHLYFLYPSNLAREIFVFFYRHNFSFCTSKKKKLLHNHQKKMSDQQAEISRLRTECDELDKKIKELEEIAKGVDQLLLVMGERLTKYEIMLNLWFEKEGKWCETEWAFRR
jgi:hypothetical protein